MRHATFALSVLTLALACERDGAYVTRQEVKPAKQAPSRPIAELFTGTSVELPPPFAALNFDMTIDEADKVVPRAPGSMSRLADYPDADVEFVDMPRAGKDILHTIRMQLPGTQAELAGMLEGKWGPSRPIDRAGRTELAWFNPDKGLRALLDGQQLEISAYMPFDRVVGTSPARFGFETTPLLGLDLAGLRKHYGHLLRAAEPAEGDGTAPAGNWQKTLELPPTEHDLLFTFVSVSADSAGRIDSVELRADFDDETEAEERMLATMKQAWGEPREDEDVLSLTAYIFPGDPVITIETRRGRWIIRKTPKKSRAK